jgi:hypothetical protein
MEQAYCDSSGALGSDIPPFVEAQNGQLESMKWLVEDMGQDISMIDSNGRGVLSHVEASIYWREREMTTIGAMFG